MQTEDHYALARLLTEHLNISRWKRAAFCFGSIEPDFNRISYMGPKKEHFGNGHSYDCRKKQIFAFLDAPYRDNIFWWYRAGKAFHYLTDSFCRPHNPQFGYRSAAHVKYEMGLHDIFRRALKGNPWKIPRIEETPKKWVEVRHQLYLDRTKNAQDDCYYILTSIPAVWNWVLEQKFQNTK